MEPMRFKMKKPKKARKAKSKAMKSSWEYIIGSKEYYAAKVYASKMCELREAVIEAAKERERSFPEFAPMTKLREAVYALIEFEKKEKK